MVQKLKRATYYTILVIMIAVSFYGGFMLALMIVMQALTALTGSEHLAIFFIGCLAGLGGAVACMRILPFFLRPLAAWAGINPADSAD